MKSVQLHLSLKAYLVSADSRYWGFVPEDHIVGTPMFVIISIDEEKGLFSGFRFDRMFKAANPDK